MCDIALACRVGGSGDSGGVSGRFWGAGDSFGNWLNLDWKDGDCGAKGCGGI